MTIGVNFEQICGVLKSNSNIIFALVFGSQALGKANRLSDVDIGIFTKHDISLFQVGKMVVALEKLYVDFKKKVFLYYMDVKPLLEMVKSDIDKRLESGIFGRRNCA